MTRLRREDGFTLMEVLVAATVGFIVVAATMGLLESTLRLNLGVAAKTDAMQRGRLAMDDITRSLRSQVCLDLDHPAMLKGATDSSVTLYTDFSQADGTKPPEKRTITRDPVTGNITMQIFRTTVLNPAPTDFPGTPSQTRLVLENTKLRKDAAGKAVPFLQYYAYKTENAPTPHPEATDPLPIPLTDAGAARVARIDINYTALPTRSTDLTKGVGISDQIAVRHADPNLTVPDPACV